MHRNWFVIGIAVALGLTFCALAIVLGITSFPDNAPIAKQILVTVYVKRNPAQLLLRSFIDEANPANDLVIISVVPKRGGTDPSLLVVQCPSGSRYFHKHQVKLKSATSKGGIPVIAKSSTHVAWKSYLDCYKPPKRRGPDRASGVPEGQTINVALPVLEAGTAAQLAQASAPVFAEEKSGQIAGVVEPSQAPGTACPTFTPASSPSPGPSAAGGGNGASASASPSPAGICNSSSASLPAPKGYFLPTTVNTVETLQHISLTGDQIESMFPPGRISSNNQITWQGAAGLSPSLSATNLSSERTDNINIFIAGISAGLGLSLLVGIGLGIFPPTSDKTQTSAAQDTTTPSR